MERKAVSLMCCAMHIKKNPIHYMLREEVYSGVFWYGWLQIAPHHLVNRHMVLWIYSKQSSTYLVQNIMSALSALGWDEALYKNCVF